MANRSEARADDFPDPLGSLGPAVQSREEVTMTKMMHRWMPSGMWVTAVLVLGLAVDGTAQESAELVIRNGLIVTEAGRVQGICAFRPV